MVRSFPALPVPAWPQWHGRLCLPQAAVAALVVVPEQAGEFQSVVALAERCEAARWEPAAPRWVRRSAGAGGGAVPCAAVPCAAVRLFVLYT